MLLLLQPEPFSSCGLVTPPPIFYSFAKERGPIYCYSQL